MKSTILYILLLFLAFSQVNGQDFFSKAKEVVEETSDPAAETIMKEVKAKYQSYTSMQVNMHLKMEGENEEEQNMKAIIQGDKYRLELPDHDVICDGKTIWFHLKDINEVQINNPSEDGQELTPAGMIKLYEQDMIYVMVGEAKEEGRYVHKIEFKPRDRDSDFSKFRVSIDKSSNEVTRIIAFDKAASRYIITFKDLVANKAIDSKIFSFNPANFKDIVVEDLRVE